MTTNANNIYLEENYKKAIDAEVQKKSQPLESAKQRKKQAQREIAGNEMLKEKLNALNDASRELYGFRSPFTILRGAGEGVGEYFDVTANKSAERTPHTVEVKSMAQSQKFSSRPFPRSEMLPAGTFKVAVGGTEKKLSFRGGSLAAFQKFMEKELGDEMKCTLVQKDRENQVMVFDVLKAGIKNRFSIIEDPDGIMKSFDLFTARRNVFLEHAFSPTNTSLIQESRTNAPQFVDDALVLGPQGKTSLALSRNVTITPGLVMNVFIAVRDLSKPPPAASNVSSVSATNTDNNTASGVLSFDRLTGVTFGDITLNAEPIIPYGEWALPKPPASNTNDVSTNMPGPSASDVAAVSNTFDNGLIGVTYADTNGGTREVFFPITGATEKMQRYSIALDILPKDASVRKVIFNNNNTDREVTYRSLVIENPRQAETVAKNSIQEAENARMVIDGVPVDSDKNEFENVVAGVTIRVKKKTDAPKTFTLEPDQELVVGKIVDFIKKYNAALTHLNNAVATPPTDKDLSGIDELKHSDLRDMATRFGVEFDNDTTDNELRRRIQLRGVFNGAFSINSLRQKMRDIVIVSYPTRFGESLSLLAQVGISSGKIGSKWDDVRSGYLAIEEKVFLEKLEKYVDGIGDLFGIDAEGNDGTIDNGVGFRMSDLVASYTKSRGIIDSSLTLAKDKVKAEDQKITKEEELLADYRKKREMDYGKMMSEMKKSQRMQRQFNMQQKSD